MKIHLFDRRGFSLLELGLVLVVTGLIVGALWLYAANAFENQRKNKLISQTISVITNARRVFGNAGAPMNVTTSTAMTTAAIRAGIFPADMVRDGSNRPRDAFGGEVVLAHNTTVSPPQLRLSLSEITQEGCVGLLSKTIRDPEVRRQYGITRADSTQSMDQMPGGNDLGNGEVSAQQVVNICTINNGARRYVPPFIVHIDFRYY